VLIYYILLFIYLFIDLFHYSNITQLTCRRELRQDRLKKSSSSEKSLKDAKSAPSRPINVRDCKYLQLPNGRFLSLHPRNPPIPTTVKLFTIKTVEALIQVIYARVFIDS
jgi:hypothetical protein